MAKRGRKPTVTKQAKERIIASLRRGLSLTDALLAHGISHTAYVRAKQEDGDFGRGVKSAAALGKDFHLGRIEAGERNWQASAWFLERKYGAEYGQKVKLEHGGRVEVAEVVIHTRQEAEAVLSDLGETGRFSGRNGDG